MQRYETLMLSVPEITTDEISVLQSGFESLVTQFQATTISFERWGKYKLAYAVKNNEYGVYFLVRFQVGDATKEQLLKAIGTFFAVKNNELIMRHVITALDANDSLVYQRPLSLEETPAREVEVRGDYREGRGMSRDRAPRSFQREAR